VEMNGTRYAVFTILLLPLILPEIF
jgi:hypothetical protein